CPKADLPTEPEPGQAPLERGLSAVGAGLDSLALPRAEEAGYWLPTTYPAIDGLLDKPLSLGPYAETLGVTLDKAVTPSSVLTGLAPLSPAGTEEPTPPEPTDARQPSSRPTAPAPTALLDSEKGRLLTGHLPAAFLGAFRELCSLIEEAAADLQACDSRGRLQAPRHAAEEFFIEGYGGQSRYRNHATGMQTEFLTQSDDISVACIQGTATELLVDLEALLPALSEAATELPSSGGPLLNIETSLGPVIVGSTGSDRHLRDAALILDPGGDDHWENNAGSNVGLRSGLALALDLGGKDQYNCRRTHCQGAAYAGVGILIDAGEENDDYFAQSHAQGAGFLGVGVLWDQGGDDTYQADSFGQGAGTLGLGLLLDSAGNDRAVLQARGQGFGATGGLGIYTDFAGDDQRRLGLRAADVHGPVSGGGQGGAWGTRSLPWRGSHSLHGGVGLLYDRAGNDGYYARAFGQGSAWFLGLGLLLDRAGDDRYIAEWYGQGSAVHLAAGILVDGGGSDSYEGSNTVQGAAMDRSVGILWDQGGEADSYRIGTAGGALNREIGGGQAWARQAHAIAILVDEGGADSYKTAWDGLGFSLPPARPDRGAVALFADLDGTDTYSLGRLRPDASPANDAVWVHGDHGVSFDTRSTRAGWDHRPPLPDSLTAFTWDPTTPVPELSASSGPGDLSGNSTARWLALDTLYRSLLDDGAAGDTDDQVKELALNDADPAVRRAAARILVARADPEGLDILVDSLPFRSEDTWNPTSIGSLPFWLSVVTEIPVDSDTSEWRQLWRAQREDFDMSLGWSRAASLDRALLASGRGDTASLLEVCQAALDSGQEALQEPCGQLVGFWAWVLSQPEAGNRHDPQRAVDLGQVAVTWLPGQAEHFINLARAFVALDETDLAIRSLDKASVLDPDAPGLIGLRRELGDESSP
ncbi:MAG: hypothetical protein VX498_03010, partial [Myxococcota bacterium]|nr:hypothetical protein [Myxococcota bacterium]